MRRNSTELVQFGVIAFCDDITIANERRRFGGDRAGEKVANIGMLLYSITQLPQQWRVDTFERSAQRGNRAHRTSQLRKVPGARGP